LFGDFVVVLGFVGEFFYGYDEFFEE